ncbi:hypothetical protein C8J57DRAFT_1583589 [Mycena rebaudengoi]|nr:hypothetical protein C8J57DRAFT_1583589 [Mycena rebaudengoi]
MPERQISASKEMVPASHRVELNKEPKCRWPSLVLSADGTTCSHVQAKVGQGPTVYGIIMLDILQTVMVTADAFHCWTPSSSIHGTSHFSTLVIALVAQIFYCWRIYFLRKSFVFPVIIALIWLVGSAVSDVVIAAVLCWTATTLIAFIFQLNFTSQRGGRRIDSLLGRPTTSNLGGSSVSTESLLVSYDSKGDYFNRTAIIGKLYTNCLITVLNNRKGRDAPSTRVLNSANTTVPAFNPPSGVHISRTQKVHIDRADFPPVEMDDFPKPSASELDSRSYE